ncbi:MAG TPA: amino acid--tRNA ligase-related protein, partial [Enhygromyxa sp.]|nr:amino acid--tRNA ligase-related protein [Enhygromyxa sp.]
LSELEPGARRAARFESHVAGVELANGYRELRDAAEQRRRFELVAAMRARHDQPPLPLPEEFLAELDRLPACAGVALGLDRLLALACGRGRLDEVALGFD